MKIDFHVHTNASPCSDLTITKVIKKALLEDLSAIAICNHNKKFDLSEIPYELEEKLGIKINPKNHCKNAFYIFSGAEKSCELGHLLTVELGNDTLTIIAHPFERHKNYIKRSQELNAVKSDFMAVECGSGRANYKNKSACDMAKRFAVEQSLPICAGSDAHFEYEIGNAWTEIPDSYGVEGIKEAILNGKAKIYYKNEKRVTVAKSQIHKNGYTFKSLTFLIYCYIRDIGDKICQR